MRILAWHVHGSWMTAFVQGRHDYVVPTTPDRGPDGLGRARTWNWPAAVVERSPEQLRTEPLDLVVLQRPHELELVERWTGRRPGLDLPAVYLEHDAPHPSPAGSRHVLAERDDIVLAHVTHFNRLMWDNGRAPVAVIEHGVVDPGELYTGKIPHAAVVINEPCRRRRVTGSDLLATLASAAPIDHFGNADGPVPGTTHIADLPQARMLEQLARRRVYVHPNRWTSLGLSLIEAMLLGMPVVALAATEARRAVAPDAGVVSCDLGALHTAIADYVADADLGRAAGKAARAHALERYSVSRFQADWDALIKEVTG